MDDLRGTPMSIGTLEEIINDNHTILSIYTYGPKTLCQHLSFVDKDLLKLDCSGLLSHKVHAMIGVLMDDTGPLVIVMKVEKAPRRHV